MKDETIYEPLKNYETIYKDKVNEIANQTIDELIKTSKVSEIDNETLVKNYKKALDESNKADATLHKFHTIRVWSYILMAVLIGAALFLFYKHSSTVLIIVGVVCLLAAIGVLVYILKRLNPIIKHSQEICIALDKKEKDSLNNCYLNVAPLNNLFDYNMAAKVVEKACPMIQLDEYFNNERLDALVKHFGYQVDDDPKTSTILIQSGTLNKNPFIILRNRVQTMVNKPYTGSKIISWTETYTDSDGHSHTRTRTQTLVATIYKPVPDYHNETYLVYGNEAGSNLSFSRTPTYNKDINDEKDIDKFVRKREDDLEKHAEKATKKGQNFTALSNTDFEVLFNALDRNNEVEFRFLFTPLAQNNEVDLITKNKYYGDDFTFRKFGPVNYLHSRHIQSFDLEQNPLRFRSYDINLIRENFVSYVNDYFRNVYFELAPVLAIPAYQQHTPSGWVYDDSLLTNYPGYVEEVMSNTFNNALIKAANSKTESIVKINNVKKVGTCDLVNIRAFSYDSTKEVEYVSKLGGDGRFHLVPVFYDQYFQVSRDSNIVVTHYFNKKSDCDSNIDKIRNLLSEYGITDVVYKAGLLAFIASDSYNEKVDMELNKIMGYNKDNLGGN